MEFLQNNMFIYFIFYFFAINLLGFFLMFYDKKLAQKHEYRISEKTLFIVSILLGGIGIFSGMYKFRHKTKHLKFTIGIPVTIVLNAISIYYIFTKIIF